MEQLLMTSLSTFTDEKSGTSPLAIRASFGAHEEATRENSKPRYVRRNVASAAAPSGFTASPTSMRPA